MKDYSLSKEEHKQFIKSYFVKDDKIIAILANGENYVIPYNDYNETRILFLMRRQVERFCNKRKTKKKFIFNLLLSLISMVLTWGTTLLFGNIISPGPVTLAFCLTGTGTVLFGIRAILNKIKLNDIKKTIYFSAHKKKLNEYARTSENILLGVSKKAIKQIKNSPIDKPVFDINLIDKYSLADLKKIIDNIQRYITFDFKEEQAINNENKGQAKILDLKNND